LGIRIRPPKPDEWPACRMLVPEPFLRKIKPETLLALDDGTPAILGAIAYQHNREHTSLFRIRVIAPRRRQGIGTELVRRLFLLAQERSSPLVSTYADTKKDAAAEPFLLSLGFGHGGRLFTVEVDLEPMLASMAGLRDRLVRSGRVPADARLLPLAEAPKSDVARLYDTHILAAQRLHPAYIEASLTDKRYERISVVAMEGDRVAGILVVENEGELARVPARVVAPGYRGGWVNVLMMAAALETGKTVGIRRVQFDSLAANSDTLKLARRYGAETVRVGDTFQREISPVERFGE
jgi:GNAT superfamily N-acetyltransferase